MVWMEAAHVFIQTGFCVHSLVTRVPVFAQGRPSRARVDAFPLLINTSLSFQIHELLQHYEESKPVPVQDSTAALVNEVSLGTINLFYKAQVGGNTAIIKIHVP